MKEVPMLGNTIKTAGDTKKLLKQKENIIRIDFSLSKILIDKNGKGTLIKYPSIMFGMDDKISDNRAMRANLTFYEMRLRSPLAGMAIWYNNVLAFIEDYADCSIEDFTDGNFKYITQEECDKSFYHLLATDKMFGKCYGFL